MLQWKWIDNQCGNFAKISLFECSFLETELEGWPLSLSPACWILTSAFFFSAKIKSELKVCSGKKSVDANDGRLARVFLPVFAPIAKMLLCTNSIDAHHLLPQCFCLSALTLTGKEFNNLYYVNVQKIISSSQAIGNNFLPSSLKRLSLFGTMMFEADITSILHFSQCIWRAHF